MIKCEKFSDTMYKVTYDIIKSLIDCNETFFIKIFATDFGWEPKVPEKLIEDEEVINTGLAIQVKSNKNIKIFKDYFLVNIVFENKSYLKKIYLDEIISVLDNDRIVIIFNNFERPLVPKSSDLNEVAEIISGNEEVNKDEIESSLNSIIEKIKGVK